jgi:hypothetical protein
VLLLGGLPVADEEWTMNVRVSRRDAGPLVLAAAGVACFAFGLLEIVNPIVGFPFVAIGGIMMIGSIRRSPHRFRTGAVAIVLLPIALAGLGWSSEHLGNGPDCSHAGAVAGQWGYWSGATLQWNCVEGRPVIIRDTR